MTKKWSSEIFGVKMQKIEKFWVREIFFHPRNSAPSLRQMDDATDNDDVIANYNIQHDYTMLMIMGW